MAKPLRIEYPGAFYHITSRGNAKMPIFDNDEDREFFIGILEDVVKGFNGVVHAYCMMDNHNHLLVSSVNKIFIIRIVSFYHSSFSNSPCIQGASLSG